MPRLIPTPYSIRFLLRLIPSCLCQYQLPKAWSKTYHSSLDGSRKDCAAVLCPSHLYLPSTFPHHVCPLVFVRLLPLFWDDRSGPARYSGPACWTRLLERGAVRLLLAMLRLCGKCRHLLHAICAGSYSMEVSLEGSATACFLLVSLGCKCYYRPGLPASHTNTAALTRPVLPFTSRN